MGVSDMLNHYQQANYEVASEVSSTIKGLMQDTSGPTLVGSVCSGLAAEGLLFEALNDQHRDTHGSKLGAAEDCRGKINSVTPPRSQPSNHSAHL